MTFWPRHALFSVENVDVILIICSFAIVKYQNTKKSLEKKKGKE